MGGSKRKLSLAISLVGRPAVLFLDEPSTGMDPVARRHVWRVIEEATVNAAVVLTTHSMEECEALCTRLGIMVSGRFRCIGSSQHLKNRFGGGYCLEIKTPSSEDCTPVTEFVEGTFAGARCLERHVGTVKYHLPKGGNALSSLFRCLEAKKADLKIEQYGISQFTLEQVFIAMAKTQNEETA